jgi:tetratricopeptide (TPR) repeat protein
LQYSDLVRCMDITFLRRNTPFILFIGVFIAYLNTVCPTVYVGDSGELTAAAFSLGIPHPSGYPLFALIGKLFCLIPFGSIAFRVNLMSVVFSSTTVLIVYSIIYRFTSSNLSSIFGALILAFSQIFWLQTVSAEVYPLHTFFVAVLIKLLIYWNDNKSLSTLSLFSFVVGLSFLNHLQTVMMAPAVFFFLIYSDRKGVLNLKTLLTISILFLFALTIYLYLPIRTNVGAAIHWGDPDTFDNFWNVVSGANHRSHYIFGQSISYYLQRTKDAYIMVYNQFGIIMIAALWGFVKLKEYRWKLFFLAIIFFDFFYTIFLNTVFIEITAFNLPTLIVISILSGIGINHILNKLNAFYAHGQIIIYRFISVVCYIVPAILLISNYNVCDQSRNYVGYEHLLNALRTINHRGTIFVDGDNNLFPVTYARFVERMREDVVIYDKKNLFFIIPDMIGHRKEMKNDEDWSMKLNDSQKEIIRDAVSQGVFFFVFNPYSIELPENHSLIPYGTLSFVINHDLIINKARLLSIWKYYASESLEDNILLDYMNREVTAHYYFVKGRHLVLIGGIEPGLKRLRMASEIGYNDEIVNTELALFYTDKGLYELAKQELEKALIYGHDLAIAYNNWGYYYSKTGNTEKAINSIRKAVEADPINTIYYNNLGNMLMETGQLDEAVDVFKKSLSIKNNQENIKRILLKYDAGKVTGE